MPFGVVRVIEAPERRVAVLAHHGDPARLEETVRRFVAWRRGAGWPPERSATFNILYGDPAKVAPADFRLDVCAVIEGDVAPNEAGVVADTIPGGRCAVLRLTGRDDGMGPALAHLCGTWLPASGERRRDAPLYCQRVAFPPAVPPEAAITDIFLPLVERL